MRAPKIRIGLIQATAGPDPADNLGKTLRMVKDALRRGAQVICLQELFSAPYFPKVHGADMEHYAEPIPGKMTGIFAKLARQHGAVIIVPLIERGDGHRSYNSAVIIRPNGTIGRVYRKVHIPQDPHYYEKEYFSPGSGYVVEDTPFGRIAVLICYDQWFPEAARVVSLMGAQVILYPTALGTIRGMEDPCEGDWEEAWQTVQRGHAIANGIHLAAVNRVGEEGDIRFFGGSFVCDAFGNVVAKAGKEEEVLIAEIDLSMNDLVRDGWGFFRNRRPETYGPLVRRVDFDVRDTPNACGFHMPAEWEPHQGIWLSWPYENGTFYDLSRVEQSYLEMIQALQGRERIFLLVRDREMQSDVREFLSGGGIDLRSVRFTLHPYADVWFRDYGPTFLVHEHDPVTAMVNWKFNAWGGKYPDLEPDDIIPSVMEEALRIPSFSPGMVLEGGSIEVDGCGTLMTTEQCLLHPNRNPSRSKEEIEQVLGDFLGISRLIWLKGGIAGDDTDGHIDDVARFVDTHTVVCALEEDRESENYDVLRQNYGILQRSAAHDGSRLRVVPLPLPGPVEDPLPASYTNFYIGNGVVLVPTFDDPADDRALRILREIFFGRTVTGIDCCEMIRGMGAIHCVSQQHPSP
jgi:agmatine deiminase